MKYEVHRLNVTSDSMQEDLKSFLNDLKGEVVSIIPNYAKTTFFQIYGLSSKINFILIVEKIE